MVTGDSSKAGFRDGPLSNAIFDHPDGIVCLDKIIIVADTYNHRIRMID